MAVRRGIGQLRRGSPYKLRLKKPSLRRLRVLSLTRHLFASRTWGEGSERNFGTNITFESCYLCAA